ncbi:MAG: biotin/lipoyl-binding protein, partial [Gammaproteobacteria bacterium]|nr:biotin/lipoyl-binding protein [Gammaproteobacteria bacterium]
MAEIRIPDIGDAENVEVIELCVAPGDSVGPDDAILVIESDKASMEVPAGISGTLEELLVGIGDPVEEGQLIARLSDPEQAAGGLAGAHPDAAAGVGEAEPRDAPDVTAEEPAGEESIREPQAVAGSELVVSVPDIGDAQDVLVIEVAIGPGDSVGPDDAILVIESDKASMEVPAG